MCIGTYTLWLYEPVPQNISLTSAAAFDMSLSIQFDVRDEDIFECTASRLPQSLNTPAYLGM